jgi:hypothetical protein
LSSQKNKKYSPGETINKLLRTSKAKMLRHAALAFRQISVAASSFSPASTSYASCLPLAARGIASTSSSLDVPGASASPPATASSAEAPSQIRGNNAEFVVSKLDTVVRRGFGLSLSCLLCLLLKSEGQQGWKACKGLES